jgi:hypothetical protein
MIAYVTVGADGIARANRFYSVLLPALDFRLQEENNGYLGYVLPIQPGQFTILPDF